MKARSKSWWLSRRVVSAGSGVLMVLGLTWVSSTAAAAPGMVGAAPRPTALAGCTPGRAVVITSPVASPARGALHCAVDAISHQATAVGVTPPRPPGYEPPVLITPGPGGAVSRTARAAGPDIIDNGVALCAIFTEFVFIPASGGWDCLQGAGSRDNPNIGTLRALVNSTFYRVWMHQNRDGSGWADCFDQNSGYYLLGNRDQDPGNIQLTTNSSFCPSSQETSAPAFCGINTFVWTQDTNLINTCYLGPGTTYNTTGSHFIFLSTGTIWRVWLHQYADNSGWADCYNPYMVFYILGYRDETPGNLQVSSNSNTC